MQHWRRTRYIGTVQGTARFQAAKLSEAAAVPTYSGLDGGSTATKRRLASFA